MRKEFGRRWSKAAVALFLASMFHPAHAADKKPEEIVSQHLESIGTADARSTLKAIAVQGQLRFKVLVGGFGDSTGSWGRVSEPRKSNFVMRFGIDNWRGEQFIFDGNRTFFANATADHQYSTFAKFVSGHDFIIKEGLLGGELSATWTLENLDPSRGKVRHIGGKKMDGNELDGIEYVPKSGTDMHVKLYFDAATHRHAMTVYSLELVPRNVDNGINLSAHQQQLRYTLEERFSDFRTDNGITLPRHYDLQYTEELQNGQTRVYDWDMTADKIETNFVADPANFQIK